MTISLKRTISILFFILLSTTFLHSQAYSADILAVDFGPPHGLWTKTDGSAWTQLHSVSPEQIITGDIDGDGTGDIIVDFGADYGLWAWMNNTTWNHLHSVSPEDMRTGDIDGNGKSDIIIDFGAAYGLWAWMNNVNWSQIHSVSPENMATGDIDDNGSDDLIIDFGPAYGLWVWMNNATWSHLHSVSPEQIVTGDIDATGSDDIIIDFGPAYGLWAWMNNTTWSHIHSVSPEDMATGDIDGSGSDDIIIDFGATYGLWAWMNNATWKQLHSVSPEQIETGVMNADDLIYDNIIIDFGATYGLWAWIDNANWTQLHSMSPEDMTISKSITPTIPLNRGAGSITLVIPQGPTAPDPYLLQATASLYTMEPSWYLGVRPAELPASNRTAKFIGGEASFTGLAPGIYWYDFKFIHSGTNRPGYGKGQVTVTGSNVRVDTTWLYAADGWKVSLFDSAPQTGIVTVYTDNPNLINSSQISVTLDNLSLSDTLSAPYEMGIPRCGQPNIPGQVFTYIFPVGTHTMTATWFGPHPPNMQPANASDILRWSPIEINVTENRCNLIELQFPTESWNMTTDVSIPTSARDPIVQYQDVMWHNGAPQPPKSACDGQVYVEANNAKSVVCLSNDLSRDVARFKSCNWDKVNTSVPYGLLDFNHTQSTGKLVSKKSRWWPPNEAYVDVSYTISTVADTGNLQLLSQDGTVAAEYVSVPVSLAAWWSATETSDPPGLCNRLPGYFGIRASRPHLISPYYHGMRPTNISTIRKDPGGDSDGSIVSREWTIESSYGLAYPPKSGESHYSIEKWASETVDLHYTLTDDQGGQFTETRRMDPDTRSMRPQIWRSQQVTDTTYYDGITTTPTTVIETYYYVVNLDGTSDMYYKSYSEPPVPTWPYDCWGNNYIDPIDVVIPKLTYDSNGRPIEMLAFDIPWVLNTKYNASIPSNCTYTRY